MKRISHKILSTFLLIFLIVFVFSSLNVKAENEVTTVFGSSYYVEEVADEKNLGYGVNYHRDLSYTSINESGLCVSQAAGSGGGGAIELGKYYPQQVNVLELNTSEDLKIVPWSILSGEYWNVSTVRNMASDYESTHPGWKVVAATNGDFFNTSTPYGSTGVTIANGEYFKSTSTHGSHGGTIGFKNDGDGKQLVSISDLSAVPTLTIYNEQGEIILHKVVDKVNVEPNDNETSIYYSEREKSGSSKYNVTTCNNVWCVSNPEKGVSLNPGYFYGIGKIDKFLTEDTKLFSGSFAVSSKNSEVNSLLKEGVQIRLQYEFTSEETNGIEEYASFPSGLISNGEYIADNKYELMCTRHPRTMIGQKEDGTIVMAVIDGRQPGKNMYGACGSELSAIMTHYGCVDAWNLDGGGSSTLIVRKQDGWDFQNAYNDLPLNDFYVTNSPSDGRERTDGNCLLIVAKVPEVSFESVATTTTSLTTQVNIISPMEKYNDLYVGIADGEKKKLPNDHKVTFTGLEPHTTYKIKLYAYINGEYLDLMSYESYSTAYDKPILNLVTFKKSRDSEGEYFNIKCDFDYSIIISKLSFEIDGEIFNTGNMEISINTNKSDFKDIHQMKIIALCDLKDGNGSIEVVYELYPSSFTSDYLMFEMYTRINNFMESIY